MSNETPKDDDDGPDLHRPLTPDKATRLIGEAGDHEARGIEEDLARGPVADAARRAQRLLDELERGADHPVIREAEAREQRVIAEWEAEQAQRRHSAS